MYKINRIFYFLTAFTLIIVGITWLVVIQENQRLTQKHFQHFLLFPKLAQQTKQIKIMQLEIGRGLSGTQKITLWREKNETFFRIRQANNFFAKQELTNRLLYGVATLKVEAKRGNSKAELTKLGLIAPDKLGPAIRITFYTFKPKNKKRASFLVGHRPEAIGDVFGQSSIYVRREGENQSYLARGALPLRTNMQDWIDLNFLTRWLNEDASYQPFHLTKVQFSLYRKKGWILKRQNPQENWAVSDRRGLPLVGTYDKKRIAAVEKNIKALRFRAVQPLDKVKFNRPHIVIFESFSGLALILEIQRHASGYWAKITARATSLKAQAQAKKIQHHLQNFAFLLPTEQAKRIILHPQHLQKTKRK